MSRESLYNASHPHNQENEPTYDEIALPEGFRFFTADTITECYDGASKSLRQSLWKITKSLVDAPQEQHELDAPRNTLEKIWPFLTELERIEVINLLEQDNA